MEFNEIIKSGKLIDDLLNHNKESSSFLSVMSKLEQDIFKILKKENCALTTKAIRRELIYNMFNEENNIKKDPIKKALQEELRIQNIPQKPKIEILEKLMVKEEIKLPGYRRVDNALKNLSTSGFIIRREPEGKGLKVWGINPRLLE